MIYVKLFGVALPLCALLVEVVSRDSSAQWFDPIPTYGHCFLIVLGVVANLLAIRALSRRSTVVSPWILRLSGLAIGISAIYTLCFLPLLVIPFLHRRLDTLFLFAPLLAFIFTIRARLFLLAHIRAMVHKQASETTSAQHMPALWSWVALGALLFVPFEVPAAITWYGMSRADSENPEARSEGLALLRDWGDRDLILDYCGYGYRWHRQRTSGVTGWALHWLNENRFTFPEETFYRVTGQPPGEVYRSRRPQEQNQRNRSPLHRDFTFFMAAIFIPGSIIAIWRSEGHQEPHSSDRP